jgi:hypothetical protein
MLPHILSVPLVNLHSLLLFVPKLCLYASALVPRPFPQETFPSNPLVILISTHDRSPWRRVTFNLLKASFEVSWELAKCLAACMVFIRGEVKCSTNCGVVGSYPALVTPESGGQLYMR